jgi:hypothetical protein
MLPGMLRLKSETDDAATLASVTKEMAKPRMTKSARIAEGDLDATRTAEQPSTSMPGIVEKIIPAGPDQSEKAQIAVDVPDRQHRNLRIENVLIDERGDDVKLKKGGHVEITVTGKNINRRD